MAPASGPDPSSPAAASVPVTPEVTAAPVLVSLPLYLSGSFFDAPVAGSTPSSKRPPEDSKLAAIGPATDLSARAEHPASTARTASAPSAPGLPPPELPATLNRKLSPATAELSATSADMPAKDSATALPTGKTPPEKTTQTPEPATNRAGDAVDNSSGASAALAAPAVRAAAAPTVTPATAPAITPADAPNVTPALGLVPDKTIPAQALSLEPGAGAPAATGSDGTGVASMTLPMKNPQKAIKVAGLDVKDLPPSAEGNVDEKILPQLVVTPVRAADNGGADLNFSFGGGQSEPHALENAPVLNVLDLPSLADARVRTLERVQDMIGMHSMRLIESRSDVLSVVIKPSVGTELSLELHHAPDGIEARATLTQGDHEFLSKHWPDLQQRLEQRGIKLGSLDGDSSFSSGGSGQFHRQQAAEEEAAQRASAFAEFAAAGSTGGASARAAVIHEGWESWA
jgi:hypothetical protein